MAHLTADQVLQAYRHGWFPMGEPQGRVAWYSAERRGVLPLEGLHVTRSLRRTMRRGVFEIRIDGAFTAVMRGCAERPDTWITPQIIRVYEELHRGGYAHSVEAMHDGALAGGLYGVALGGAFFGESMFSRIPDASKAALVALVAHLRARGYRLLDTQFLTPHLASMGAVEISAAAYTTRLREALAIDCHFLP